MAKLTSSERAILNDIPHGINVGQAIRSLCGDDTPFGVSGGETIEDYKILNFQGPPSNPSMPVPTHDEIATELIRLQDLWVADQWKRNRRRDFPKFEEQLNKIYDDGVTKWKAEMVDPIKTKWPKDNSGPIE